MPSRFASIGGILLFVAQTFRAGGTASAQNPVYDFLMRNGVEVARGEIVRLPEPTMVDGMNAAQQAKAVQSFIDSGHTWEQLARRSVVAPFVLKLSSASRPEAIGRRIDVWFVAYCDLKALDNEALLDRLFKSSAEEGETDQSTQMKLLTRTDLARRRIDLNPDGTIPRFAHAELSVLDRVRLAVTTHDSKSETSESILAASMLDPRFVNDREFPDNWRPILRDEAGRRYFGAAKPYVGYGSYVKATRLIEPAGAILIEYHAAFGEPQDWFGGTNLLRSKLPIITQYLVRTLRRSLAKGG